MSLKGSLDLRMVYEISYPSYIVGVRLEKGLYRRVLSLKKKSEVRDSGRSREKGMKSR